MGLVRAVATEVTHEQGVSDSRCRSAGPLRHFGDQRVPIGCRREDVPPVQPLAIQLGASGRISAGRPLGHASAEHGSGVSVCGGSLVVHVIILVIYFGWSCYSVNLPIEPKSRDGKTAPASTAAKSTEKSSASTTNTSNGIHKPAAPKVEPKVVSPPAKSTSVVAAVAPKVEPETPTKKSTTVSPKKSASKTAAPPATGKSSIASFFARPAAGAKVATAVAIAEKPKPKPIDVAKDEPMDTSDTNNDSPPTSVAKANASKPPKSATEKRSPNTADLAASRKRSLADLVDSDDGDEDGVAITPSPAPVSKRKRTAAVSEKKRAAGGKKSPAASTSSDAEEIPGTPQAEPVKKATSAGASVGRGSRVRQIVDSSDEEPETLVETKKAVKRKAKRTVTRTFEDEDGYISEYILKFRAKRNLGCICFINKLT